MLLTSNSFVDLKKGTFSAVNNREIKRFIEHQQREVEEVRPLGVANLEAELMEVSMFYDGLLAKFFRFFQGFLPGKLNFIITKRFN